MEIKIHLVNNQKLAEIISDKVLINNTDEAVDILGNLYYQSIDKLILHEKNLAPNFFDLKNKIAGEILQKFSNYRVRLAVVGDFSKYTSKSVHDFILESNKRKQIFFTNSVEEALKIYASS